MIPKEKIEEIRTKTDIVKVVSEYVTLKKRGKNYLGSCPFHSEKDPSFTVSPDKQIFHCFGCNEGGNVFSFLMKIENISFIEAVADLGTKLGITLPEINPGGPTRNEKDQLYQIMQLAIKFYGQSLNETTTKHLKDRGLSEATIKTFQLGFAPDSWDNLFKHLISRGVSPVLANKAGLILPREGKDSYYDRFRNRLIIPIFDQRGRAIAIGGRSIGNQEPKYLNSPESAIYHKGTTLFGLNLSKNSIKQKQTAVIVEGYFDLITPTQAGLTNIVASLGTALTAEQCKLLSHYCDTAILAYDADSAGEIATERSINLLRKQGLKVKVAVLVGGKDPDEIIRQKGAPVFSKVIDKAISFLEFKIRRIAAKRNLNDIEAKAVAIQETAVLLSQETDPFVQKEYAKVAAKILQVSAETIITKAQSLRHYTKVSPRKYSKIITKPSSKVIEAEKNLLAIALQNPEELATLRNKMSLEDFSSFETRSIAKMIFSLDDPAPTNVEHFLLENLTDEKVKSYFSKLLISEHLTGEKQQGEILSDCIQVLRQERSRQKIGALKLKIKAAEEAGETGAVGELLTLLKSEIY